MILKIILIIIIVILAVIAYLLFAPVFFSARGEIEEKRFTIRIHDLLWLCRIDIKKDGRESYRETRILFGLIKLKPKKEKEEEPEKNKEDTDSKKKEKKFSFSALRQMGELIGDANTKQALKFIINKLIRLLGRLIPKKISADMEFALNSPDMTGYVTGVLALIPIAHMPTVHIYPDFTADKVYVKGGFEISGHIVPVVIWATIISIITNKNVRRMLGTLRRIRRVNRQKDKV